MSMRPLINSLISLVEANQTAYKAKKDGGPSDFDIMAKWFGRDNVEPLKGGQTYLKKSYYTSRGVEGPNPLGELGAAFWASDGSDYGRAEREDEGIKYDPKAWFAYLSRGTNGRFLKKISSRLKHSEYSSPKSGQEQLSVSIVGKDKLIYQFDVFAGKNDVEFRNIRTEDPKLDDRYSPRGKATADEMMDAVG